MDKEDELEIQKKAEGEAEETPAETLFEKTERVVQQDKENLDRREKILAEEQDLFARKQLSGNAEAGNSNEDKLTDEEKASNERVQAVGNASGAGWAKPKKKDE